MQKRKRFICAAVLSACLCTVLAGQVCLPRTARAAAQAQAPGGQVTSAAELQTALGGAQNAALDGSTVRLLTDVTVDNQVKLTAGAMTLDLAGHALRGACGVDSLEFITYGAHDGLTPLLINGAKLTVMDSGATGQVVGGDATEYERTYPGDHLIRDWGQAGDAVTLEKGWLVVQGGAFLGGNRGEMRLGSPILSTSFTDEETVLRITGGMFVSDSYLRLDAQRNEIAGGSFQCSLLTYPTSPIYLSGAPQISGDVFMVDTNMLLYLNGPLNLARPLTLWVTEMQSGDTVLQGADGYTITQADAAQIRLMHGNRYQGQGESYTMTSVLENGVLKAGVRGYAIRYELQNVQTDGAPLAVAQNEALSVTLCAPQGYRLPDAITVTMGEQTLSAGKDYIYDAATGTVTLAAVQGDVTFAGQGVSLATPTPSQTAGPSPTQSIQPTPTAGDTPVPSATYMPTATPAPLPVTGETGGGVWVYVLVGLGVVLCIGAAVYLVRGKKQ